MASDISMLADSLFERLGISAASVGGGREGTSDAGIYVSCASGRGERTLGLGLRGGGDFLEHLVFWVHGNESIAGHVSNVSNSPFAPPEDYAVCSSRASLLLLKSFLDNIGKNSNGGMLVHSQHAPPRYFSDFAGYFVRRFSELSQTVPAAGSHL